MRKYPYIFIKILLVTAALTISCGHACAQFIHGFDSDIRALRANVAGNFSTEYDDVLQLSPTALAYALKAFGCESRSGWDRMAVSHGISAAAMISALSACNYGIRHETPGGEPHSFPSGHTSMAFMAATMLHYEYGWRSPWWSLTGYSLASATGLLRILNDSHWASDVIGGAILGICSTHLGYWLGDLIFKDKGLNPEWCRSSWREFRETSPSLEIGFERRFISGREAAKDSGELPFRGSGVYVCGTVPLNGWLGLRAKGSAGALMFKDGGSSNLYSLRAGASATGRLTGPLLWETEALAGYSSCKKSDGPDFSAAASLNLLCGEYFKLKMQMGWEAFRYPAAGRRWLNSATAGCSASFSF